MMLIEAVVVEEIYLFIFSGFYFSFAQNGSEGISVTAVLVPAQRREITFGSCCQHFKVQTACEWEVETVVAMLLVIVQYLFYFMITRQQTFSLCPPVRKSKRNQLHRVQIKEAIGNWNRTEKKLNKKIKKGKKKIINFSTVNCFILNYFR
uniref:Uncharacterized protein n=1 Tax=Micrurus lemniscatus lemniscatus TaxID=129467 RepID=A0A2D4HS75_MICLE